VQNEFARQLGFDNYNILMLKSEYMRTIGLMDYYLVKNVFDDYILWNNECNIKSIKYYLSKSKANEYLSWLRLNSN